MKNAIILIIINRITKFLIIEYSWLYVLNIPISYTLSLYFTSLWVNIYGWLDIVLVWNLLSELFFFCCLLFSIGGSKEGNSSGFFIVSAKNLLSLRVTLISIYLLSVIFCRFSFVISPPFLIYSSTLVAVSLISFLETLE